MNGWHMVALLLVVVVIFLWVEGNDSIAAIKRAREWRKNLEDQG